jgi:hypothetical protein
MERAIDRIEHVGERSCWTDKRQDRLKEQLNTGGSVGENEVRVYNRLAKQLSRGVTFGRDAKDRLVEASDLNHALAVIYGNERVVE